MQKQATYYYEGWHFYQENLLTPHPKHIARHIEKHEVAEK
jgi:hypothetical protein